MCGHMHIHSTQAHTREFMHTYGQWAATLSICTVSHLHNPTHIWPVDCWLLMMDAGTECYC
jgi:hypothetical protein